MCFTRVSNFSFGQVNCMTVHENLNYMAVGFDNGSIVLFKGDITRERWVSLLEVNLVPTAVSSGQAELGRCGMAAALAVLISSFSVSSPFRNSKVKVIYEGRDPITGLAFKPQSHRSMVLFASTTKTVISIPVHMKEKDQKFERVGQ